MPTDHWPTKLISVVSLHLDARNPRLGRETTARAPREIIQNLFENDKALEVAESIVTRGYFPNEPLLAIREDGRLIVVEGNRRLASLKALREPGLLEGNLQRQVERLARRLIDPQSIAKVPVTIAPSRRATDRQIAGRHIGTPVLAWQAENRASFILDKLTEGYNNNALQDELGFSMADIQKARQTRAIAEMARSLDLPEEVRAKLDNPRVKLFTTIERIFESSVGREFLKIEPNADHGFLGKTAKTEFVRGFKKLVSDVTLGKQSSRTLNTNDQIKRYFQSWNPQDLPKHRPGSFVPSDIIKGRSIASGDSRPKDSAPKKAKQASKMVLPRDLKVRFGNDRLKDIRRELTKLRRDEFPNAGAVLLRVFFELAVLDYFERTGELPKLIEKLKNKNELLSYGVPTMRQLLPEIIRIAKERLPASDAKRVEKAVKYDPAAPFTLSDLHSFVHQAKDLPSERDIWQFWLRTESLFRLMLEQPDGLTNEEL